MASQKQLEHDEHDVGVPHRGSGSRWQGRGSLTEKLFNCVLFNARSLNNKTELLPLVVDEFKASLVFVTETWLDTCTPDSFLEVQKAFCVVRCDRADHRYGGGVCVLISNKLNYSVVAIPAKFNYLEIIVVDVMLSSCKVRYIVCYRPPY